MASYGNMRDAYSSIYSKAQPKDPIIEALDTLLSNGIINEKEVQSLMEREKGKLFSFVRKLSCSRYS